MQQSLILVLLHHTNGLIKVSLALLVHDVLYDSHSLEIQRYYHLAS